MAREMVLVSKTESSVRSFSSPKWNDWQAIYIQQSCPRIGLSELKVWCLLRIPGLSWRGPSTNVFARCCQLKTHFFKFKEAPIVSRNQLESFLVTIWAATTYIHPYLVVLMAKELDLKRELDTGFSYTRPDPENKYWIIKCHDLIYKNTLFSLQRPY